MSIRARAISWLNPYQVTFLCLQILRIHYPTDNRVSAESACPAKMGQFSHKRCPTRPSCQASTDTWHSTHLGPLRPHHSWKESKSRKTAHEYAHHRGAYRFSLPADHAWAHLPVDGEETTTSKYTKAAPDVRPNPRDPTPAESESGARAMNITVYSKPGCP